MYVCVYVLVYGRNYFGESATLNSSVLSKSAIFSIHHQRHDDVGSMYIRKKTFSFIEGASQKKDYIISNKSVWTAIRLDDFLSVCHLQKSAKHIKSK